MLAQVRLDDGETADEVEGSEIRTEGAHDIGAGVEGSSEGSNGRQVANTRSDALRCAVAWLDLIWLGWT